MGKVWCVWSESGEYENYSRDLRGVFASADLAEAHAAQLRALGKRFDSVGVVEDVILDAVPVNVPYIEYAAHVFPDGREDMGLGFSRGEKYRTFSNELVPAKGMIGQWSHKNPADVYVKVVGSDEEAVAAEYARLLEDARGKVGRLW